MSKVKDKLIADLAMRFGNEVRARCIVDYLYGVGTLDDGIAKRHMIKLEFVKRLTTTGRTARQIQSDLSEEFGIGRTTIQDLTKDLAELARMAA